ncbi:MAG: hypothetical protein V2I35_12290 [Desulfocapsaceae bacterium]|nr:hypothetical protein [Desulfocapsaceae bacterium]
MNFGICKGGKNVWGKPMRMICPNCGLGGTARDEYYLKNVQCPDCLKIFTAAADVLVDPPPRSPGTVASPDVEISGEIVDDKQAVDSLSEDLMSTPEDSGISVCEVCGFRFSSDFIRMINGRRTCPVCLD